MLDMRVKLARVEKGLTQLELSKLANVSNSTINKIETVEGHVGKVGIDRLKRIANALGKTFEELYL